jgi:antirestriction protein ArdC
MQNDGVLSAAPLTIGRRLNCGNRERLQITLGLPGGKRFGDEAYAMEELVAELGSAFLCGDLGLSVTPRPDHACYLASWLKVLKGDNRAIFAAASAATKAAEWLGEG